MQAGIILSNYAKLNGTCIYMTGEILWIRRLKTIIYDLFIYEYFPDKKSYD